MTTQEQALLLYRIEQLEEANKAQEAELSALRKDIERQEAQRLKWGIVALGTVVSVLATVLWSLTGDRIQAFFK